MIDSVMNYLVGMDFGFDQEPEEELPEEIEKYRIKIAPEKIHSVLYYANLFYGESATMASESAVLGTPSIYLDDNGRGYTDEQEKLYGLVFNYDESIQNQEKSIDKAKEILSSYDQKKWKKSVFDVYQEASLNLDWTKQLKETCEKAGIAFLTSLELATSACFVVAPIVTVFPLTLIPDNFLICFISIISL